MNTEWTDTRWLRIVSADGRTLAESSNEQELLSMMKPGDTLQRWQERKENRWVEVAKLVPGRNAEEA